MDIQRNLYCIWDNFCDFSHNSDFFRKNVAVSGETA